jgi:hypothetical protein
VTNHIGPVDIQNVPDHERAGDDQGATFRCHINIRVLSDGRCLPVAHAGILAKIGAKKREKKNAIPVVMPAIPVFAPSAIPVDDSTNGVTGDVPKRALVIIPTASTQ